MTGRETLMSMSSRRAGECVAGSTRLAWWMGDEDEVEDDAGEAMSEKCWEQRL